MKLCVVQPVETRCIFPLFVGPDKKQWQPSHTADETFQSTSRAMMPAHCPCQGLWNCHSVVMALNFPLQFSAFIKIACVLSKAARQTPGLHELPTHPYGKHFPGMGWKTMSWNKVSFFITASSAGCAEQSEGEVHRRDRRSSGPAVPPAYNDLDKRLNAASPSQFEAEFTAVLIKVEWLKLSVLIPRIVFTIIWPTGFPEP